MASDPKEQRRLRRFKPLHIGRSSSIPWLGRTRLMAHVQQSAVKLKQDSKFPSMAAFLKVTPWLWHYFLSIFHTKYGPYPGYELDGKDGVYPLRAKNGGKTIRIAVAGDWGTGTEEAFHVGEQMSKFAPDYTIHLGDVYYVGDGSEVAENFLGVAGGSYEPVGFPKGSVGTLALAGNHELYCGGRPYFKQVLPYCETGTGKAQQASFFCLETEHWRIIGLDTGYNSAGTRILGSLPLVQRIPLFGADCHLETKLLDWLCVNVKPQESRKATILLSHHQYFGAFKDAVFPRPAKQLKEFFAGQDVVWIWGHEHRLAIYDLYSPDGNLRCYGRCLGNGGMPVEVGAPGMGKAPCSFYDARGDYSLGDGSKAGWNGFMRMTVEGETVRVEYVDLKGKVLFVEMFLAGAGGALSYSFETPVPVLTAATAK